ncbi:hypothetical protein ACJX0J_018214, partial [Zea mays]
TPDALKSASSISRYRKLAIGIGFTRINSGLPDQRNRISVVVYIFNDKCGPNFIGAAQRDDVLSSEARSLDILYLHLFFYHNCHFIKKPMLSQIE